MAPQTRRARRHAFTPPGRARWRYMRRVDGKRAGMRRGALDRIRAESGLLAIRCDMSIRICLCRAKSCARTSVAIAVSQWWWAMAAVLQFAADAKAAHAADLRTADLRSSAPVAAPRRDGGQGAGPAVRSRRDVLGRAATIRPLKCSAKGHSWSPSHRPSTRRSVCTRRSTVRRVPSTRVGASPEGRCRQPRSLVWPARRTTR
jgi:hypothetical protein